MLKHPLSKSALQLGAQCPRMLWIKYNMPYSKDPADDDGTGQEQFEIGNIVGAAAQGYFSELETVIINTDRGFSPDNYSAYHDETVDAMNDPDVGCIAEATFYTGDLVVFIDLLVRNPYGGWDIYEVKSANRINPIHVRDAAWQTYVARDLCGVEIQNTYLMHPYSGWHRIASKDYVDEDDFEIVDDFSDFIYDYSTGAPSPENNWMSGLTIAEAIDYLSEMVEDEYPPECVCEPGMGMCCTSPYQCIYTKKCAELFEDERN